MGWGSPRTPGKGVRSTGPESRVSWPGSLLPPCLLGYHTGAPAGSKTNVEITSVFLGLWGCRSSEPPAIPTGLMGARAMCVLPWLCRLLSRKASPSPRCLIRLYIHTASEPENKWSWIFYFLLGMQFFHIQLILEQGRVRGAEPPHQGKSSITYGQSSLFEVPPSPPDHIPWGFNQPWIV